MTWGGFLRSTTVPDPAVFLTPLCFALEVNGIECWSARELQKLLGYSLWQNFTKVINKAKEACENVGQLITDHFIDANKMIIAGKGAQRDVDDILLIR